MPINRKMMKSMKDQYGPKRGERAYYATERKQKQKGEGTTRNQRGLVQPMGVKGGTKMYNKGGMVSNCGASMKPNGKSRK